MLHNCWPKTRMGGSIQTACCWRKCSKNAEFTYQRVSSSLIKGKNDLKGCFFLCICSTAFCEILREGFLSMYCTFLYMNLASENRKRKTKTSPAASKMFNHQLWTIDPLRTWLEASLTCMYCKSL